MLPINWKSISTKEIMPGFHGRFVHTPACTIAYWEIDEGAALPEHHHINEQVALLLEGEFELTVEGNPHHLQPNSAFVLKPDQPHSGKALTKCVIIDVFTPPRTDLTA